ncbi:MAG: hypothetical protein UT48_C0046G0008 [Parcubacteria group bacterium GW2011_GWE2_39_37]|uniref:Transposase IS200-like domain-containing protein n=1 Tax=Candidatus Falkowbacteria bacterium GW2011_GWF2_39_8 TaxID=1618642 RepID=A0A0G0T7V2_9BACT|nr:MAG: hypothetical protein UT48_C0046G0008 [Parcubacteria group bacterium GW2011_GWE2_39_37]KKR33962.1 MAG: hypothetical protein UT64_C0001G0036 [Candidatus Falkowbacteria bacterium GW2011_GWF2_39_8]
MPNLLFKNKYRIASSRHDSFDYSENGFYFVTINTNNQALLFGNIQNEKIILSKMGAMAEQFIKEIPNHFSFVNLDEFVVMPNHIHIILEIKKDNSDNRIRRDAINRVSTNVDDNINGDFTKNHNPMGKNNLSEIIRWYKGRCSFEIRKELSINFSWQSRFYDRIIRTDDELNKIRQYIIYNPLKWDLDRNNPKNFERNP